MMICKVTQKQKITEDGETAAVFGIVIREAENVLLEEPDLGDDREAVQELAAELNALQPEPLHFADILEDFVNRE